MVDCAGFGLLSFECDVGRHTRFVFKLHISKMRPEWKDWSSWLYWNVVLEN